MKKITKSILGIFLLLALFFITGLSYGQSIWTNPIDGSAPSSDNPFTSGDVKNANIRVSGIGMAGVDANAGANAYNTKGWPQSNAIDTGSYFSFTLTPNAGYVINFSSFEFSRHRSGSGPQTWAVRSSLDNYGTNIDGTFSPGTTSGTTTINLLSAAYQNVAAAITFRIYCWDAGGGTGTARISDFAFNGTVTGGIVVQPPVATAATLVTTTGFTAHWNAVTGATGYRIDVSANADFTALLETYEDSAVTGTSYVINAGITANTTYYYRVRAEFGSETSQDSNIITLTTPLCDVVALPVVANQTFCGDVTVAQLMAIAPGTISWFENAETTTPLELAEALTTGTYYVSQTLGDCESLRAAVVVTVNPLTNAPIAAEQFFCESATASQLIPAPVISVPPLIENFELPISGGLTGNHTFNTGVWNVQNLSTTSVEENTRSGYAIAFYSFARATSPAVNGLTSVTFYAKAEGEKYLEVRKIVNGIETVLQTIALTTTMQQYTVAVNETGSDVKINLFAQRNAVWAYLDDFSFNFSNGAQETIAWYDSATSQVALSDTDALFSGTYYVSRILNGCESTRTEVPVTINGLEAPAGAATQDFTAGETLADLDPSGENIVWYVNADLITALPATTLLTDATVYYAVQINNSCESLPLAVTVSEVLNNDVFSSINIKYYPNPVKNILYINSLVPLTGITVYNSLGQKVIDNNTNTSNVQVDMNSLSGGVYVINVVSGSQTATFKVIK